MDEDELFWTGGILDGDGCVCLRATGRLVVTVKQAERGIELLRRLHGMYGGGVYSAGATKGGWQKAYQWEISGHKALEFCRKIAKYTRLKRPQFELAAEDDPCKESIARLRELKRMPHGPVPDDVPLSYIAGFVDADGSIDVYPVFRAVVTQKYPSICTYFTERFGGRTHAYKRREAHEWRVTGEAALAFVREISPWMYVKKPQADIMLALDRRVPRAVVTAHEALRGMKGYQGSKPDNPTKSPVHLVAAGDLEDPVIE